MTTILNIMFGKGRGGLEQAAVDYAEALRLAGFEVLTVTHPKAWVNALLDEKSLPHVSIPNFGAWDILAAWRLKRVAERHHAAAAICHGNRALSLSLSMLEDTLIVAVAHNYHTRHFAEADICFAITDHSAAQLAEEGVAPKRIFTIPNMVRLPSMPDRPSYRAPVVVGSMGRFVPKKAYDLFIEALALLKARGVPFTAVLGGDGEQSRALKLLVEDRQLTNQMQMPGWVEDKAKFFNAIDIFVLPSHHEPFGIVLLEAMAYGVPVITTDAEGPREIVHHGADGLLVPRGNAKALADAMAALIEDPAFAAKLARGARALVDSDYGPGALASRLKAALDVILPKGKSTSI